MYQGPDYIREYILVLFNIWRLKFGDFCEYSWVLSMCFLCGADFAGWSSYHSHGTLLLNEQWPNDDGKQGQAFFFFSSRCRPSMIVWIIIDILVIWATHIQSFPDKRKHRHRGIAAILEQSAELLTLALCLQQPFKSYVKLPLTEEKFLILILWMNNFWSVTGIEIYCIFISIKKKRNIMYSRKIFLF